jgi:hypothetical protein
MSDTFNKIQEVLKEHGTQYYGDGGTIHHNNHVDVEVDNDGNVVSVWFRCCLLPFKHHFVDAQRAKDMNESYASSDIPKLHGVEIKRLK